VVLGLGLLELISGTAFLRPLHGTVWTLVIAVLVSSMTVAVQLLRAGFLQIGTELEEAAQVSGASRLQIFRRILIPLLSGSFVVVALEIFATANSVVGIIALLGVGPMQPLSVLQLNLFNSGQLESAGVVGVVIVTVSLTSALMARIVGNRIGLVAR
jgi:ABC-type Fe3+ transport system permease subunit